MQKPGTNPTAQPEIQFAGSLDVPASQAPRDPAVAAAFMAFHRRTDGGDRAAAGKGPFSRGAVALASLAFLGFGGGLFLAFFSFNSPEGTSSRVAARPPEVIYTARMVPDAPPQDVPAALDFDASESADPIASPVFALGGPGQRGPDTSIWRDLSSDPDYPIGGSYASAGAPAFAGISELTAPGEGPNALATSEITTGFGALTVAPVPEPSTWATMISGAGLLMLVARFKRGRG